MTVPGAPAIPPAYQLTLERAVGITDEAWKVIEETQRRLARALEAADHPLALGVAKEMVETIAKIVLATRGEVAGSQMDYDKCVTAAHKALVRLPGQHLSNEPVLKQLVQSAKGIATQLAPVRNAYGTGHGRAEQPDIPEEMLHLCLDGALLWSRWALRRLGVLTLAMPEPLIRDLKSGTFYGGTLAPGLKAALQTEGDDAVLRRLGMAVGQRAMRDTHVVQMEGVQACAESNDLHVWPATYRAALFEGLFIDATGRPTVSTWSAEWASRVIAPLDEDEAGAVIKDLETKLADTNIDDLTAAFENGAFCRLLHHSYRYLPPRAQEAWTLLLDYIVLAVGLTEPPQDFE
ncbi:abortive infection family protein [Actinomadura sp. 6K520]|uniref:abortive infection family protein n=1 Tax=Actinomadura sp. 6K520 TaxID=2530364 RepID=UPI0014048966|nr:abortive infection family protein [Actinomadura sp. 6K520]